MVKQPKTMSTAEYNSALKKLGRTSKHADSALGISGRQSQRFANDVGTMIAAPVRKLLRLAIKTGTTAEELESL